MSCLPAFLPTSRGFPLGPPDTWSPEHDNADGGPGGALREMAWDVQKWKKRPLPWEITYMEVSINEGTPIAEYSWMVYMGNPIKMDDFGVPVF